MLIDTHSHLYDEKFDEDREAAIDRAREAGIGRLLLPAIDRESYDAMFALARHYPDYCFPMMGLHPTSVNDNPAYREDLETVARYLSDPPEGIRFCGIGEAGLDLYWSRDFLGPQIEALQFQAELAIEYDLPLILHTREAWDEMCDVLSAFRGRGLKGIMHSFCGTETHYRRIREYGTFLFGIGGPVTYKRSAVAEVLPRLSPEEVVLETDCPYLPPVPFRGQRNESAYVVYVCRKVAEIYGMSPEKIAEITTANVRRMFGNTIFS